MLDKTAELNQTVHAKKRRKRRNKKLLEKFQPKEEEEEEKGGKGAKGGKKEEKKDPKKDAKKDGKNKESEEEEAERLKKEQEAKEEAERLRIAELEANFDAVGELRKYGGRFWDFNKDSDKLRSQHYSWTIPIFFKEKDKVGDMKRMFVEVSTISVQKALVSNPKEIDFGEIPVAFRKVKEVMLTNIGQNDEELQMDALTPFGGFSVLNARRVIKPGETKPVLIEFKPFAQ